MPMQWLACVEAYIHVALFGLFSYQFYEILICKTIQLKMTDRATVDYIFHQDSCMLCTQTKAAAALLRTVGSNGWGGPKL
jgi:hypothetical protein